MKENIYQKNIGLLYVYSVLIKRVSMPIIVLYYLANNLNFTQIGILASVAIGVSLILDIQGGIFADTHGRKMSFVMHSVTGFFVALFLFLGDSFGWFLISSVIFGVGSAFITGTKNSFLYDTLICMGKEKEFKKYNGKNVLYSHLVNAAFLLTIPAIYQYNQKLPFLIVMAFYIVSIVVASFFVEPEVQKKTGKKFHLYGKRFVESLKEIKFRRDLKYMIILSVVVFSFVYFATEFTQPLLKISGLPIVYFGVVYALRRLIFGFGSSIAYKIERHFSLKSLLFFGIMILSLSFLGRAFGLGMVIVVAILLGGLVDGTLRVFFEDEINKRIDSENRTTILSISNFLGSILKMALVFVFGILADLWGVQEIFVIASVALIVFTVFVFLAKNRTSRAIN